ncbi:MAG TPA: hypothetical protein PLW61_07845 [Caldisericia bacterium]|nr:hypothetical protein [Caldisericia bacterium]
MKFQIGQKVKVKSKEQLLKWFEENGFRENRCGDFKHLDCMTFKREMFDWCDYILTIRKSVGWLQRDNYKVLETSWCFLGDWLSLPYSTFVEIDDEF